ncbi:MAG TPA: NAD(P)/FAD-dependent oxidoreductase [Kofleriaceae bacterium]|nr:NAD(P)/FAD-dependent oxidoreductase [Kofleriaceae bacterium]
MQHYDAVVVGSGPGGSSCARWLVQGGLRVALLDRAQFPRVKLCAGWLSLPVWDALELRPSEYPAGLWPWERCHVELGGKRYTSRARGYFVRRYEFDDYLVQQSGADRHQHVVKTLQWDGDAWIIDDQFRATYLVGAGGTHCPVARALFPAKPRAPVGVQEHEFPVDAAAVVQTRIGADGEPYLLLHDDLRGYSWNISKTDWLNVGCGTVDPKQVRAAWRAARTAFETGGSLPASAGPALDHMKGHSYYLFDPEHLRQCQHGNALLVGDALGLAQPITAEGILPAIVSARRCADAILAGDPGSYRARLQTSPVFEDYTVLYRAREAGAALRARAGRRSTDAPASNPRPGPSLLGRLTHPLLASGFAWMFSGQPLPARGLMRRLQPRGGVS